MSKAGCFSPEELYAVSDGLVYKGEQLRENGAGYHHMRSARWFALLST